MGIRRRHSAALQRLPALLNVLWALTVASEAQRAAQRACRAHPSSCLAAQLAYKPPGGILTAN